MSLFFCGYVLQDGLEYTHFYSADIIVATFIDQRKFNGKSSIISSI